RCGDHTKCSHGKCPQMSKMRDYLYFVIVLMLYIVIVVANALLIVTICMKRSLHEPMYVFLCSLLVNQLYGSAGLFPFLLLQITSDSHTISRSICFLQIYCLYTYASVEVCNLAVMSYDRYLAICCPLHYKARLTSNKVALLIALVWLYSFIKFLITLCLNLRLKLCGNVIDRLFCFNYDVVLLACSDTTLNNIYGRLPLCRLHVDKILCTNWAVVKLSCVDTSANNLYGFLLMASRTSKTNRRKFFQTCLPHVTTLTVFTLSLMFDTLFSRYGDPYNLPALSNLMAAEFLVVPPLVNPLVYGMNLQRIHSQLLRGLGGSKVRPLT
uniref:Olfactory receptor n=1 Tax=Gadus morhua TaxID=8049 RepID=A0A8C4ZS56_GADMO